MKGKKNGQISKTKKTFWGAKKNKKASDQGFEGVEAAEGAWVDENHKSLAVNEQTKTALIKAAALLCVAAGPLALGLGISKNWFVKPETTVITAPDNTSDVARVSGVAVQAVKAWWEASAGSPGPNYFNSFNPPANSTNQIEGLAVSDVTQVSEGRWSVQVSGLTTSLVVDPNDASKQVEQTQFLTFQVGIEVNAGGLQVVSMPAIIPSQQVSAGKSGVGRLVNVSDPLAMTLHEFMNALIAGGEIDLSRYLQPGSSAGEVFIGAIPKGTFLEAKLLEVKTIDSIEEPVADGVQTSAEILVQFKRADGASIQSAYRFGVIKRDGRWEISSMVDFPISNTLDEGEK